MKIEHIPYPGWEFIHARDGSMHHVPTRETIEKMQAALEFYAEPKNWRTSSTGFAAQYDPGPSPVETDGGALAIAARSPPAAEGDQE